jgi:hypothetical protein
VPQHFRRAKLVRAPRGDCTSGVEVSDDEKFGFKKAGIV